MGQIPGHPTRDVPNDHTGQTNSSKAIQWYYKGSQTLTSTHRPSMLSLTRATHTLAKPQPAERPLLTMRAAGMSIIQFFCNHVLFSSSSFLFSAARAAGVSSSSWSTAAAAAAASAWS